MTIPYEACIAIWEQALAEEIGLVVFSNNPRRVANDLYDARKVAARAEFSKLSIHFPSTENELFVVRRDAKEPEEPEDGDPSRTADHESDFESL